MLPLPRPVVGERDDDAEEPWSPSAPLEPPPIDPNEGPDGPWDGRFGGLEPDTMFSGRPREETPVGFLIVQRMLLTGFDAPLQQALYVDRPVRRAELLQAVARTNR